MNTSSRGFRLLMQCQNNIIGDNEVPNDGASCSSWKEPTDEFEKTKLPNNAVPSIKSSVCLDTNLEDIEEDDFTDSDKDPSYAPQDGSSSEEDFTQCAGKETIADERELDVQLNTSSVRARKRKRMVSRWKCNIRKDSKNAAKEYVSKKGVLVAPKQIRPPCLSSCKKKCTENITEEERQEIFKNFYNKDSSNDLKRLFVANSVQKMPVARRRERDGSREARRNTTYLYYFEVRDVRMNVCKTFFLNTLSISDMYVQTAMKKRLTGGLVISDQRGKHQAANKLASEVRDRVRAHIKSFPTIDSHYSRERSAKLYLGNDLNISKMYDLFLEQCKDENVPDNSIAKKWLYYEVFNFQFNLAFKQPANDTCDDCDAYSVKLKNVGDEIDKSLVQIDYDTHLLEARRRYDLKSADKIFSKAANKKIKTIMMDLQKCLATPFLTNSQAFYLRKLWTLNLTIYDSTLDKSYCAMWDETVGARGACEIASCVTKWALDVLLDSEIEELTIWSDNCPGQNRNFVMVVCYFYMLRAIPSLKVINHKFLLRGHTHMEVDGIHSIIERSKKCLKNASMMIPWDWQQFVRMCRPNNPIHVYDMKLNDFINFKSLYEGRDSPLICRKRDSDGPVLISEMVHMQVRGRDEDTVGTSCILYYKTSFDEVNFKHVDVKRTTRRGNNWPNALPAIRQNIKPINVLKYRDLQTLLRWIPETFYHFYKNIPTGDTIQDYPPEDN